MFPCQIHFPCFWDRIMTLGTFICRRVTYLCPFLTMCTGPYCNETNKLYKCNELKIHGSWVHVAIGWHAELLIRIVFKSCSQTWWMEQFPFPTKKTCSKIIWLISKKVIILGSFNFIILRSKNTFISIFFLHLTCSANQHNKSFVPGDSNTIMFIVLCLDFGCYADL